MDYEAIPTLKIEIQNMKHSIIAHLGATGSELGEALNGEIMAAVDNYPWQKQVTAIVHEVLNKKIESYFSYGPGSKAVDAAVEEGFKVATGLGT